MPLLKRTIKLKDIGLAVMEKDLIKLYIEK